MRNSAFMWAVGLASALTAPCGPARGVSPASAWLPIPAFGVQVEAPVDARLQQTPTHAFVGNGSFMLNLFIVDGSSAATAAEQLARSRLDPDFVRPTSTQNGTTTWRFDYELTGGAAGTIARIAPGRALDCGIHHVSPSVAAAVATACAGVKRL